MQKEGIFMKRTPIQPNLSAFPEQFRSLITGAKVYDSSCSPAARVWFLDTDEGLYLKSAPAGTLETEAAMTAYFHTKGIGPKVLAYCRDSRDWLLTRAIPGEDCTHPTCLEDPKRLSETLGILLRQLHSMDFSDCPVIRNETYKAYAGHIYKNRLFDPTDYPDHWGYATPEDAWRIIETQGHLLKQDVLLHGDYCLPNVMLNNWQFSGFIDVGHGGIGDRHIDLFWGLWSLGYNLKTNVYSNRFLDAYGRADVEEEMFSIIRAFECFG